MSLDALSARLGVEVKAELLELALTHRSFAYENGNQPNNERLEFLGDSVLGFVVTEHLYKTFPKMQEDELSRVRSAVVSTVALDGIGRELGIDSLLRMGKGQSIPAGRSKVIADAVEAIIGAAFVDGGLAKAAAIVEKFVIVLISSDVALAKNDPKTRLQELAAARALGSIEYVHTFEGPDHDRNFDADVLIAGEVAGSGRARTRKAAETAAAEAALANLVE
jgi:ribonuclease-3